jgi:hypothetical protein
LLSLQVPSSVTEAASATKHVLWFAGWLSFSAAGAKLFYLSGIRNGKYLQREVLNLARFISVMKFRPLSWRLTHPYLLTDRFEVLLTSRAFPLPRLLAQFSFTSQLLLPRPAHGNFSH